MKSNHIVMVFGVVALTAVVLYSFSGGSNQEYRRQILKEREEKDQFMRTSEESPFASDRESFDGLKYFPPDERYRITADLEPVEKGKIRVLPTSDGKEKKYREYAIASFDLDNRKCQLLILEITTPGPHKGTLFLPFGDQTSANETYGAGRYLELKKVEGSQTIELDFNHAYNPYCAYSDGYSCPFPPRENLLDVAIPAGEKNYK